MGANSGVHRYITSYYLSRRILDDLQFSYEINQFRQLEYSLLAPLDHKSQNPWLNNVCHVLVFPLETWRWNASRFLLAK